MRCFDDASKAWRKLEKRSHMHSFLFFFYENENVSRSQRKMCGMFGMSVCWSSQVHCILLFNTLQKGCKQLLWHSRKHTQFACCCNTTHTFPANTLPPPFRVSETHDINCFIASRVSIVGESPMASRSCTLAPLGINKCTLRKFD